MPNYAPRVSLPYYDVSGVIELWSQSCDSMAVYEHEADEEVNTTHVHLIMLNSKYKTPERLKQIFRLYVNDDRNGNDLWAWTHKNYPNPDMNFITYMSKGNLRPVFLKNISPAEVEELRNKWVAPIAKGVKSSQSSLVDENDVKKSTKFQVVEKVVNLILAKSPLLITEEQRRDYLLEVCDEVVLKAIRNVLIAEHQALGLYKVIDIYDTFVMYHQKNKFLSNCLNVLQKRLPRV